MYGFVQRLKWLPMILTWNFFGLFTAGPGHLKINGKHKIDSLDLY